MPIQPSKPPASALEAVQAGTRAVLATGRSGTPALRAADASALTFDTPLQVFVLGADDLAAGKGLAAARAVAWRYLIRDGHGPIATVDAATPDGNTHRFSHINEGPFVGSTADAMASLGNLAEARDGVFDARLLEIPALHSTTLWLHTAAKHGDLLVPLAPAPPALRAGRSYPAAAFLATLEKEAAAIGPDEGPTGKSGS
jgi:hypothetical protein